MGRSTLEIFKMMPNQEWANTPMQTGIIMRVNGRMICTMDGARKTIAMDPIMKEHGIRIRRMAKEFW